jgi:hypothetical protein
MKISAHHANGAREAHRAFGAMFKEFMEMRFVAKGLSG